MQIKRNGNKLLGQQTIYIENGSGKKSKTLANLFEIDIKSLFKKFDIAIENGQTYYFAMDVDFIKKEASEIKHFDVDGYLGYANSHRELEGKKEILKRSELLGGDVEVSCLDTLDSFIDEMYKNYRKTKLREIAEQATNALLVLTANANHGNLKHQIGDDYKEIVTSIHDAYNKFDGAMKEDKLNAWTLKRNRSEAEQS
ncbi:hypothetical protein CTH30272_03054 [Allocatenococcus thiocycli]|nr:hypothetical protein CTH30272_03054 [Catenococcus thiocycli]